MRTIYLQFREIAGKFKRRPVVHWALSGKSEKKRHWRTLNYLSFLNRVDRLSEGLRQLGVKPGDRVALMCENGPDWLASDLALNRLGAVSVPIHTTSNKPLIEYILKDSGSGFLIASNTCIKKNFEAIKEAAEKLKVIVVSREEGWREELGKEFAYFDDLLKDEAQGEIAREELASIIYTSGTTGEPKGVMLTNENLLSNIEAALEKIKIFSSDVFLSILPVSHVLERMAGNYVPVLTGASIAYAPSIKELAGSLAESKPTVIIGVPKIFENSYEKIVSEIEKKNKFIKKFFYRSLKRDQPNWVKIIADKLMYSKIRKKFGGRLRFSISGGAAINERIIKFFGRIGIKIIEGYGLTETSPIIAMNTVNDIRVGTVGRPASGVEVKIAPDKEILVKGKNVMKGYWNKKELTDEVLSAEGWFRTGDLGFLDRDNFLTIIGRKKEILVTSNGKNISPEKVEAIINLSPIISQSLVIGHKKPYLACLVVADKKQLCEKYGEGCDVKAVMEKEIDHINHQLMSHERIRKIEMIEKPFTIEEEELTPTLKVRRSIIEHKYHRLIERIYS
ncbi:MAG: AMP-dependent synthetase/ligase [Patescibacteria group bacterium]|jgi:long-chain acyl-CoA synthetase